MAKLFAILVLILSILLFPPAALALISNNAVPGDATYPIKRGLEDVIYAVASIHPTSKAWFSAARSDRRFKEINILVTQGKEADQTLEELVQQTQATADQINQIKDVNQKKELVKQLNQSIEKYDKGLASLPGQSTKQELTVPTAQPTSAPITKPKITPEPVITTQPTATVRPTSTPRPTVSPTPASTAVPTSIPINIPTPISTPEPPTIEPSACDRIQNPVARARCELKKIRGELGTQTEDNSESSIKKEEEHDNSGRGGDENTRKDRKNSSGGR